MGGTSDHVDIVVDAAGAVGAAVAVDADVEMPTFVTVVTVMRFAVVCDICRSSGRSCRSGRYRSQDQYADPG